MINDILFADIEQHHKESICVPLALPITACVFYGLSGAIAFDAVPVLSCLKNYMAWLSRNDTQISTNLHVKLECSTMTTPFCFNVSQSFGLRPCAVQFCYVIPPSGQRCRHTCRSRQNMHKNSHELSQCFFWSDLDQSSCGTWVSHYDNSILF